MTIAAVLSGNRVALGLEVGLRYNLGSSIDKQF